VPISPDNQAHTRGLFSYSGLFTKIPKGGILNKIHRVTPRVEIRKASDAVKLLDEYRSKSREHMIVIHMTPDFDATAIQVVSIGSMVSTSFQSHDIFRKAILLDTMMMIVAHNHPYEKRLKQSVDDQIITEHLIMGGGYLKIQVVDHIILGEKSYFSFRENGVYYPKSNEYFNPHKADSKVSSERGKIEFFYPFGPAMGQQLNRRPTEKEFLKAVFGLSPMKDKK
jgi:DNA repair protein RadC